MKNIYLTALCLGGFIFSNAQVYDVGSGAQVIDISNTGVAVGNVDGLFNFMWSEEDSGEIIGEASENGASGNQNITDDGEIISVSVMHPETNKEVAAVYFPNEDGEWFYFEGLGHSSGGSESSAWGMSSNGDYVAGFAWSSGAMGHGMLWTSMGETIDLGTTVTNRSSRANGVNADGTRVIGWQDSAVGYRQGVYWDEEAEQHFLKDNDGNILGEPSGISADGKTIVGSTQEGYGYIWNETDGTTIYEGEEGAVTIIAAVSDDGTVATGFSFQPFEGMLFGTGFIWTKEDGFQDLNEYVESLDYDNLGIMFSVATAISPDGQYIGGIGVNWEEEDAKGFLIKRPGTMSTQEVLAQNAVSIYPNPVKNDLNIVSKEKIEKVDIYNVVGQKVLTQTQLNNNSISVSQLAKGTYILKVKTKLGVRNFKFIKE